MPKGLLSTGLSDKLFASVSGDDCERISEFRDRIPLVGETTHGDILRRRGTPFDARSNGSDIEPSVIHSLSV